MCPDEIIEALVSIVTGVLVVSFWSYKTYQHSNYTHLDNLWVRMLELYRANPEYLDHHITQDYKNKLRGQTLENYGVFALTLQSTMESIYDVYGDNIPDEWIRIFKHHSTLHKAWLFDHPQSFRPKFLSFVAKL